MNQCGVPSGLQKAHTSDVSLEYRNGQAVVIKRISKQARQNEVFFHKVMQEHGLPCMQTHIQDDELVIDYIVEHITLEDAKYPDNY